MTRMIAILIMMASAGLSGCALDARYPIDVGVAVGAPPPMPVYSAGPPPWAPAYGYQAPLYDYYYYPDSGVYYSLATGTYFYLQHGAWQFGMTLPPTVVINPGAYVSFRLATDRPYRFYGEHRMAYRGWHRNFYSGHEHNRKGRHEHGHGHGHWK